jgi:hypothetical protein
LCQDGETKNYSRELATINARAGKQCFQEDPYKKIARAGRTGKQIIYTLRLKNQKRIVAKTVFCFFIVFGKSTFDPTEKSCNHGKWF